MTTPATDELAPEAPEAPAQEQLTDAELMERIQAEFANRPAAPAPAKITIADLYTQGVQLVCGALGYKLARLKSEQTAVRIYELTLMWALNNRSNGNDSNIFPTEELGGTGEASEALVPDEIITGTPDEE